MTLQKVNWFFIKVFFPRTFKGVLSKSVKTKVSSVKVLIWCQIDSQKFMLTQSSLWMQFSNDSASIDSGDGAAYGCELVRAPRGFPFA